MNDIILAPASSWQHVLASPSKNLIAEVGRLRSEDPAVAKKSISWYADLVAGAVETFGREVDDEMALIRSPGRVNLLGTHIDHRGGRVNPIAVRELALVVFPREDGLVRIANADDRFAPDEFIIDDLLPNTPIEDWADWTLSTPETLEAEGLLGTWGSYPRAACAYMANLWNRANPDGTPLRGFDAYIDTQLPSSAGLSSSSALTVGSAIALHVVNGREFVRTELAEAMGQAEWYVGTRGGSGDQAAILLSQAAQVSHIDFYPMTVDWSPWPEGYSIVVAHSRTEAQKSANARSTFNERVATYGIALLWIKQLRSDWSDRLEHMRDVLRLDAGLDEIYNVLRELPFRATRDEVLAALPQSSQEIGKLFSTHDDPESGYRVRDVCLYGLAEMTRSKRLAVHLRAEDVEGMGVLIDLSHEGDRVTQEDEFGFEEGRVEVDTGMPDEEIEGLIMALDSDDVFMQEATDLAQQPGGYACSSPALDELVDLARTVDGVVGAGLIGAGIGGCIEIIVEDDAVSRLVSELESSYYEPNDREPFIEVMRPVEGAGPVGLA
jgi:N-acetylgalactosamine kinase